jgi:hypothetical protein
LQSDRPRLGNLLVVSGPSGAGKTTFIGDLKAGALPEAILAWMPHRAIEWRVVRGGRHERMRQIARRRRRANLILHVDTTALAVYPDIAAGAAKALRMVDWIGIIDVTGRPEAIVGQCLRRAWDRPGRRDNPDPALALGAIEAAFRDPACSDGDFARLLEKANLPPIAVRCIVFCRAPGWMAETERRWREVLAENGHAQAPRLSVEPSFGGPGEPAWRVAKKQSPPAAARPQLALRRSDLK